MIPANTTPATAIRFGATKLAPTGKTGILVPDEYGYYTVILGALNTFNSAGDWYTSKGAEDLFKSSSTFMRQIAKGVLHSEHGHPVRETGMGDRQFLTRVNIVREDRISSHIADVWLDFDYTKNFPERAAAATRRLPGEGVLIPIAGKVKPTGPYEKPVKDGLDNPKQNIAYSIRAFTEDFVERGQNIRVLDSIITWDSVVEPGINIATKWDSPALECYQTRFSDKVIGETLRDLREAKGLATENRLVLEALEEMEHRFRLRGLKTRPEYLGW